MGSVLQWFKTNALDGVQEIYADLALFLPRNSLIFIGQGLTKGMTGLSIEGEDSNFCNFLTAGNSKLIRKVCNCR